jgi:hypothetical protein
MEHKQPIYGLMAEFDSADSLLAAAKKVSGAGYTKIDAFSPMPIHGLSDAIGFHKTWVPLIVLCGGFSGTLFAFLLCTIYDVWVYPMNIAGRPHLAWPAYIIPMFECTVLFGSISAVLGMLALNGLPMPYHPLFNVPEFELASRTHFFLVIKAPDPQFDLEKTREFLASLNPLSVSLVPSKPWKSAKAAARQGPPQPGSLPAETKTTGAPA